MLLIFTMILGFGPGLTLYTQAAEEQKLELHAFYPAQMTFSDQSKKYIDSLDSISFAWGRLYGDLTDGVNTVLGKNGNTMFYYPSDYADVLKYASSKNKSIQLSIFSDSVNAAKILPYKEQRDKAVNAVAELLERDAANGGQIYFDGVVIDFEGLQNNDTKGKPVFVNGQTIGSWYVQFLKELKARLTSMDKTLFVAVNPLLNYSGYNYKDIAATADKMIVMAHDYEPVSKLSKAQVMQYTGYNSLNPIDSLAPIKKIQLAMEDIKKNVNKADLSKVLLQISFDAAQWRFKIPAGSSWTKTGSAVMSMETRNTPTYQMIDARVLNTDGKAASMTYGYNNELQTPFIQYFNKSDSTENILLYENGKSVKAKIDMVKQYGLGGISLWSLANVPDYTDKTSKAYGLDVWDSITGSLTVVPDTAVGTKVTFADKVVETAVRKQLMKPTGTVYSSELAKVYRLAIPAGVKSLADLKKLVNLEYLDLNNANITGVADLGSLKNLRVLYLQRNGIADITPLKSLTKLEILSVNGNKISNISAIASLAQLTELYIRDNRITDYTPVSKLTKLNILYVKGNASVNFSKLQNVRKGLLECDF